ncbi:hypothetical protein OESDEN_02615 [Oesophagostomum dentatum]|uniref:PABS domain-containing protein n=1 Tax=Oesophagostomum dentatum TaxID=61180 RepID=A0A0B1TPT2_OESDE|nr:hypothetical protein OESDEN_02615 [Oesophagostomum dentatum]
MAYVASKWFSLKLDSHHSLVVADGVSFVEEEVKKGRTYDVLFLDACYSDSRYKILCPTDAFLANKVIHSMSRLISYDGILVINAAPGSMSMTEERKVLTELFSEFFRYCNTRIASGINEVFYCMNRAPDIGKHVNLFEFLGFPVPARLSSPLS